MATKVKSRAAAIFEIGNQKFPVPKGDEVSGLIYSTMDYDKFIFLPENREPDNYERLALEMQQKNLQQFNPVRVTKNMEVIDGQNTILACRLLGIPVHYIWDHEGETLTNRDIAQLNSARKNWLKPEYLHHFCSLGYKHYMHMKDTMDRLDLSLNTMVHVARTDQHYKTFTLPESGKRMRESVGNVFNNGRWIWTDEHDAQAEIVASLLKKIQLNWPVERTKPTSWTRVADAVAQLMGKDGFDQSSFEKNIERCGSSMLQSKTATGDYIRMLKSIYNFHKSTNRIE